MWQEGGKARKAGQGRAQESLWCQSHNLMFKNDDRIQVMDFSQENVTEMSQEQLWWKEKNRLAERRRYEGIIRVLQAKPETRWNG